MMVTMLRECIVTMIQIRVTDCGVLNAVKALVSYISFSFQLDLFSVFV